MTLTDDQIKAGLGVVLDKLRRATLSTVSNTPPGRVQEEIAMDFAMASIDVDAFKQGARIR